MKKRILAVAMACFFMIGAVGCSNTKKDTDNNNVAQVESDTRTVTDAKGEVTIPAEPKRIVDLSGNSDTLAMLGFEVVGTCNTDAYDYTVVPSYLEESLGNAEVLGYSYSKDVDLEAIIALNPDLIIISGIQEASYAQLSEIAPTILIQLAQMDWKEDFMTIAKLMDKEDMAKTWLADYETEAKTLGEEIKNINGKDATYLSVLSSDGTLYVYDGAAFGSMMYEDLGLARPANLPNQENVSLPVVTNEGLAQIDADFMLLVGKDEEIKNLENSGIWSSIKAVAANQYITLPASPYFNQGYSPVGRKMFLDEVRSYLNENK